MKMVAILGALALSTACACSNTPEAASPADDDCRGDVAEDVGNAAEVAGQGIEAGVETGAAGVEQAARATGGLVTGGTDKADEEWKKGGEKTDAESHEGAAEVAAAKKSPCRNR